MTTPTKLPRRLVEERDVRVKMCVKIVEGFAWDDDYKFSQKAIPIIAELLDDYVALLTKEVVGPMKEALEFANECLIDYEGEDTGWTEIYNEVLDRTKEWIE